MKFLKKLISKPKPNRPDLIASEQAEHIHFLAWKTLYEAFLEAGLSDAEARKAADERVILERETTTPWARLHGR